MVEFDSAPTPERTGDVASSRVNGSKTGMETNHQSEEVAVREGCGLLLLCAQPITRRVLVWHLV